MQQAFPHRSGGVGTTATSLLTFGVPQATLDDAVAVRITNHSTSARLIVVFGAHPSPSGTPTKREVPGVGLVEDIQADTPVGTAASEHGEAILPGQSLVIQGNINVRRTVMISQTGTIRVTVTPFGKY